MDRKEATLRLSGGFNAAREQQTGVTFDPGPSESAQ